MNACAASLIHQHPDLSRVVRNARRQAARTHGIVRSDNLEQVGQPGPRWGGGEPATLERVMLHLIRNTPATSGNWTSL
jgi:hypothetical protein